LVHSRISLASSEPRGTPHINFYPNISISFTEFSKVFPRSQIIVPGSNEL
jgi:hypothetical protein